MHTSTSLTARERQGRPRRPDSLACQRHLAAGIVTANRAAGRRSVVAHVAPDGLLELTHQLSWREAADVVHEFETALRELAAGPHDRVVSRADEWFVVLADRTADGVARDLGRLARRSRPLGSGRSVRVSFCAGVAEEEPAPEDRGPANDLVDAACSALVDARRTAPGTVRQADRHRRADALLALDLDHGLAQALDRHELVVHYQPLVRLRDRAVVGAEALLRWDHPEQGLLTPARFLDAAKRSGAIVEVGHAVLEAAIRDAAAWPALPDGTPRQVAVNLAEAQLTDPDLVSTLAGHRRAFGLDADQLCLEVTEDVMLDPGSAAMATLSELRLAGHQLAIDDFGTGWSSFERLLTCPADVLKIDQRFVRGLCTGAVERTVVNAIADIAGALGVLTVGEGVEDEHTLRALRHLGIDTAQGFHLGRPMPADDFARLVSSAVGS